MTTDTINTLEELRETNSTSEKIRILKSAECNEELRMLCKLAYDGTKYNVSTDSVLNCQSRADVRYGNLISLLRALSSREISGSYAICQVASYIHVNPLDRDAVLMTLDHDLKCGVNRGIVSRVWPDLFDDFSVALADRWSEKTDKKIDLSRDAWYASRKLDGVRCICIKECGEVHFFARSGKEFKTLDVLKKCVERMKSDDFVLDGECCIVNEDGDEDFISIVSEIKRKDWTISNPEYKVFDCLTLEEFRSHRGSAALTDRYDRSAIAEIREGVPHLSVVDQMKIATHDMIDEMSEHAASHGWEGIMLRKDVGYSGKRSSDMLKVKKFQDAEYEIVGADTDSMRLVVDGSVTECRALSSVSIIHRGNIVSVGSGLSKEQRLRYADRPEDLIGKTVTVKYFQESKNADGDWSLRFPTVKHIYEDGRSC